MSNSPMREALAAGALPLAACSAGGWQCVYTLPADSLAFAGHFPDHPVLPAVVQSLMAQMTVEAGLGCPLCLLAITQAKFTAVLTPDTQITLHVLPARKADHWDCTLHTGDTLAAKIQLHLQEVHA